MYDFDRALKNLPIIERIQSIHKFILYFWLKNPVFVKLQNILQEKDMTISLNFWCIPVKSTYDSMLLWTYKNNIPFVKMYPNWNVKNKQEMLLCWNFRNFPVKAFKVKRWLFSVCESILCSLKIYENVVVIDLF